MPGQSHMEQRQYVKIRARELRLAVNHGKLRESGYTRDPVVLRAF